MPRKLQWLEAMRGVAAMWVLVHHANISVRHFVGPLPFADGLIANGYIGVDFFFVLSGFIIALSANRLLETGRGFRDYAAARAIRIYVPYLPVGIAMFALYSLLPGLSAGERSPGLLTTLTLLPSARPPALSVAWTLVHEILFYAAFSMVFVSRRALWALLAAWAIAIALQAQSAHMLAPPIKYLLSPINLCFLLGVATYYLTRRGVPSVASLAGLALGMGVLVAEAGGPEPRRWLLALGFAGLIVFASSSSAQRRGPGAAAVLLGAASYSIYLVHDPGMSAAIRVLTRPAPAISPAAAFALLATTGLAAGLAYYGLYERYALRHARRTFLSQADKPADAAIIVASDAR